MAAVLACGPGSLLAGPSAGAHYGLIANASGRIDVATPQRVRRPGIRTLAPTLTDNDRARHHQIPCTSVARTILDIAAARPGALTGALEQTEILGFFDLVAIEDVMARNAGHRGVRRLRQGLAAMIESGPRFRSEFERRFLPITRAAGLPDPLVNHSIALPGGSIEVDFYWPGLRLVVEADGYQFHNGRQQFRRDRRRDRRLAAVGIRCLRFVWDDLADHTALVTELRRLRETTEASPPGTELSSRGRRG
ncbi:MAG TPA: DUF559 domain-containing protein [Solirubrobacterales bacterium]|nr:DUF559 domain-containing protein [Solirubrobacterales bacterium]